MDDYFLVIFLIFFGSLSAFFSGILSHVSADELSSRSENNDSQADKIQKILIHFEGRSNAFFLNEMFLYTLAAVVAGIFSYKNFSVLDNSWQYTIYTVLTFFILIITLRTIFSALGRRFADNLAYPLSSLLYGLYALCKPFLRIIIFLEDKVGGAAKEDASLEELDAIVETAHEDGAIDAGEYKIFKNLIHFSDVHVSDVMTPRTVLFSCEADKTVSEVAALPELKLFSRFPVWDGESIDDGVVGYVMTKEVLHAAITGREQRKLRELAREVYIIPENAELDSALDRFLKRRQHLFLVVDEYGGVEGIITMEDVLETILGQEIVDEADKVVDMRALAKQRRDLRVASINAEKIK